MSSFFTVPASQRKRKRQDGSSVPDTRKRNTTKSTPSTRPLRDQRPTKRSRAEQATANEEDDESISGSDSEDGNDAAVARRIAKRAAAAAEEEESSDDGQETAAERRLKLAERYLDNIRADLGQEADEVGFNAEDVDRELIAARLKEDVAEDKGHMYRFVAADLDFPRATQTFFRADTLATTGVAVCPPYAYTVSKDMTLIKWELAPPAQSPPMVNGSRKAPPPPRRKPRQLLYTRSNKELASDPEYKHHTSAILCVAASTSGKFVATGGADRRLIIWDAATLKPLKVFTQHRDAVTALAFRGKTNQLFSASKDRTIKIWSLDELAYVETLFGHQDVVADVAAVGGSEERCVSVGARDRSARLWKVVEESQLVFRGGGMGGNGESGKKDAQKSRAQKQSNGVHSTTADDASPQLYFSEGSLDRITQLTTSLFLTGSDSGALSLYGLHKKKPLHILPLAHGADPALSARLSSAEIDVANGTGNGEPLKTAASPTARWITALACVPYSDLVVSGSWDGVVRCWRVATPDTRSSGLTDSAKPLAKGQARLEEVGVLGQVSLDLSYLDAWSDEINGVNGNGNGNGNHNDNDISAQKPVRGIINDLKVFLRGERGRDGACVVAAVGSEMRLGRWISRKSVGQTGRNGAVVFEIPMKRKGAGNSRVDGYVDGGEDDLMT